MGLTIHYQLKCDATDIPARQAVEQLRQAALDLPFKEVTEVIELKGEACDDNQRDREDPLRWLLIQAGGSVRLDEHSSIQVSPTHLIAFSTWPGEGCEEANFGLCRYPATTVHRGKRIKTGLTGWSWHSFCKTQYASDPKCGGLENFIRCHLLVIAMLDKAKELGVLEKVSDEGRFWERRDVKALVEEIGSWNNMIAAFAGKLKDALGDGLKAPITEFKNYEQLEHAGQSELSPEIDQLIQLIKQVTKQT